MLPTLLAVALAAPAFATPPQFTAVELASYPGAPPGPDNYIALGLGPGGTVAGTAVPRGMLWAPTGVITIPSLGGPTSIAASVNASRAVAGWATNAAGDPHAFLYSDSRVTDLGTLGGRGSWAFAINNAGLIVGQSDTPSASHAFSWSSGVMTDLGSLPGRRDSSAAAVNASGRIVGNAYRSDTDSRAFVYANHAMTDLGLPPWASTSDWTAAFDINDAGLIVGATGDFDNPSGDRGFIYSNGQWTNLGLLHGQSTLAAAINNAGDVVGYSDHAFLYSHATMYDLTALAIPGIRGTLDSALDINNAGQILVHSLETYSGGIAGHYYVLTPVPAPMSFAILFVAAPLALPRSRRGAAAC